MKVAIAVNEATLDSRVAKRFGHAPFYLLVDTDTNQVQVIENLDADHDHHHDDHHDHDDAHAIIPQMVQKGVKVFITGNIGPHAFEMVQSLSCRVALARGVSAAEALGQFKNNQLKILTEPTVKRSQHDHTHH